MKRIFGFERQGYGMEEAEGRVWLKGLIKRFDLKPF